MVFACEALHNPTETGPRKINSAISADCRGLNHHRSRRHNNARVSITEEHCDLLPPLSLSLFTRPNDRLVVVLVHHQQSILYLLFLKFVLSSMFLFLFFMVEGSQYHLVLKIGYLFMFTMTHQRKLKKGARAHTKEWPGRSETSSECVATLA